MCTANYEHTCSFLFLQLSVISWLPVIRMQGKSCPIAWDYWILGGLVNCVLNLMGK